MSMIDSILWIIYPYTVMAIVILALLWKSDMYTRKENSSSVLSRVAFFSFVIMFLVSGIAVYLYKEVNDDTLLLIGWTKGLLTFNPRIDSVIQSSVHAKIHLLSLFAIIVVLPFTTYMKIFITPIQYLFLKVLKKERQQSEEIKSLERKIDFDTLKE